MNLESGGFTSADVCPGSYLGEDLSARHHAVVVREGRAQELKACCALPENRMGFGSSFGFLSPTDFQNSKMYNIKIYYKISNNN